MDRRQQPPTLQQLHRSRYWDKPLSGPLPDIPVDANKFGSLLCHGEVGPSGLGADIDLGSLVELEEPAQAVGVVIVAVGQHPQVHIRQVHPKLLGVVGKPS